MMMFGFGILAGIMAGGGGVVTTDLAANLTANATTVTVLSTDDFLTADYMIIGSERIAYTNTTNTTFVGCTRGYDDTTAASHLVGARVYSPTANAMNNAAGFSIVAVQDTLGWAAIIAIPIMFFTVTIPHIMLTGRYLFTGDLAIIMWIYYAMVAAFIVTLALYLVGSRRVT